MLNYCRSLTGVLDNLTYHAATGDSARTGASAQRMSVDHPDLGAFHVYAAGPDNFPGAASRVFLASDLPCERLFQYSPAG